MEGIYSYTNFNIIRNGVSISLADIRPDDFIHLEDRFNKKSGIMNVVRPLVHQEFKVMADGKSLKPIHSASDILAINRINQKRRKA